MENIKLHDTICVTRAHKDPQKTWYGYKKIGLLIEKGEKSMTVKWANSEQEELPFDEEEYTVEITLASEIEYADQIKKAVCTQEIILARETETLRNIQSWLITYENSICLLGRLRKFFNSGF